MGIQFTAVRRVTHQEALRLEAEYWASRSMAERVIAGWSLAEDDLFAPEVKDEPEERTAWTLAALLAESVEYVVVGGVAVNVHGFVRNTRDLDIFIRPTFENAQATFRALGTVGAPLEGLDPGDLFTGEGNYQLETEHGRIEILTFIGEMPFDRVWRNRVDAEIDEVTVHFISQRDLIENKRQVGRLIDLTDVERLEMVVERDPLRLPEE